MAAFPPQFLLWDMLRHMPSWYWFFYICKNVWWFLSLQRLTIFIKANILPQLNQDWKRSLWERLFLQSWERDGLEEQAFQSRAPFLPPPLTWFVRLSETDLLCFCSPVCIYFVLTQFCSVTSPSSTFLPCCMNKFQIHEHFIPICHSWFCTLDHGIHSFQSAPHGRTGQRHGLKHSIFGIHVEVSVYYLSLTVVSVDFKKCFRKFLKG